MNNKLSIVKNEAVHADGVDGWIERTVSSLNDESISNVAIVAVTRDGSVMSGWANGRDPFTMIGGLDVLKSRLAEENIE